MIGQLKKPHDGVDDNDDYTADNLLPPARPGRRCGIGSRTPNKYGKLRVTKNSLGIGAAHSVGLFILDGALTVPKITRVRLKSYMLLD